MQPTGLPNPCQSLQYDGAGECAIVAEDSMNVALASVQRPFRQGLPRKRGTSR